MTWWDFTEHACYNISQWDSTIKSLSYPPSRHHPASPAWAKMAFWISINKDSVSVPIFPLYILRPRRVKRHWSLIPPTQYRRGYIICWILRFLCQEGSNMHGKALSPVFPCPRLPCHWRYSMVATQLEHSAFCSEKCFCKDPDRLMWLCKHYQVLLVLCVFGVLAIHMLIQGHHLYKLCLDCGNSSVAAVCFGTVQNRILFFSI